MSSPAERAAERAWAMIDGNDAEFDAEYDPECKELVNAANEALTPVKTMCDAMKLVAACEDAEVEHGMNLVLAALGPLVYSAEELEARR